MPPSKARGRAAPSIQQRPPPRLSRLALERAVSSHDQVAAILGTEILKGVHPAGSNMPGEPELMERFHVSRTVLREAMKTLAAKGFVVSKTRVGTRVRDPIHWNFFDADVLAWRVRIGLDDEFMASLTEVRRALEPAAAALAARRRTDADIVRLREHVLQMGQAGHTRQSFAEADLDFHLAIGAASGNPLMRSVASVIEAALVASFVHSSPVDDADDHERTVNAHAAVVDAIESRDQSAAAQAMREVIDSGVERIRSIKGKHALKR
jgi:DNA-binding FadR family transcriptional regulator